MKALHYQRHYPCSEHIHTNTPTKVGPPSVRTAEDVKAGLLHRKTLSGERKIMSCDILKTTQQTTVVSRKFCTFKKRTHTHTHNTLRVPESRWIRRFSQYGFHPGFRDETTRRAALKQHRWSTVSTTQRDCVPPYPSGMRERVLMRRTVDEGTSGCGFSCAAKRTFFLGLGSSSSSIGCTSGATLA